MADGHDKASPDAERIARRERTIVGMVLGAILLLPVVVILERLSGLDWDQVTDSVIALVVVFVTDVVRWVLTSDPAKSSRPHQGPDRLWFVALWGGLVSALVALKRLFPAPDAAGAADAAGAPPQLVPALAAAPAAAGGAPPGGAAASAAPGGAPPDAAKDDDVQPVDADGFVRGKTILTRPAPRRKRPD